MSDAKSQKNKLPEPLADKNPKGSGSKKNESDEKPDIQTKQSQTGIIEIKEDPTKGQIRIFRFKLLVTSCQKNTAFKKGEMDLKNVEHVHWYRTHDARTGIRHERATLACGHSHPMEIVYVTNKEGVVTGIDMDKSTVGPAIREVSIGAENSPKRQKIWMAVKLGEVTTVSKETEYEEKTVKIHDKHNHVLDYIDYEDINLQKARLAG